MGTKNQSMAAKRQSRNKTKRSQVTPERKNQKIQNAKRFGAPTDEQLQYELATNGIVATANKYRSLVKNKSRDNKGPTNNEIVTGMLEAISLVAPIHSSIELADKLAREGKITFTPEEQVGINEFDRNVVHLAEDMAAIRILIEEGQTFEDFGDVYIHYMDLVIEIVKLHAPTVYREILKPHADLIQNYALEHVEQGERHIDFALRMHDQRLNKIEGLYRTTFNPEDLAPSGLEDESPIHEFIPADSISEAEMLMIPGEESEIKDIN